MPKYSSDLVTGAKICRCNLYCRNILSLWLLVPKYTVTLTSIIKIFFRFCYWCQNVVCYNDHFSYFPSFYWLVLKHNLSDTIIVQMLRDSGDMIPKLLWYSSPTSHGLNIMTGWALLPCLATSLPCTIASWQPSKLTAAFWEKFVKSCLKKRHVNQSVIYTCHLRICKHNIYI